jgi:polar amino acid transport system substrate-binding protein
MKISRVAATAVGLAMVAVLAACGTSATDSSPTKPNKPIDVGVAASAQWREQGTIRVGIACDYPPFGYTDIEGKNAGYDAEVARTLAAYAFGDESKVSFTCVTPQNRIPYLQTNKIDLIVSTLGYTKERAQTIDYSAAYFTSGAKLLVPAGSKVAGWADIKGQPVITKVGTTSSTFIANCYSDSKQLQLDSTNDAVTALKAGRAVAFAEDSTLLLGLTLNDPSLKVVGDDAAQTPWGIGIRKGDEATKTYVDAVLADMQKKDTLWNIFGNVVKNEKAREAFAQNMPRPGQNIAVTDENTLTKCS